MSKTFNDMSVSDFKARFSNENNEVAKKIIEYNDLCESADVQGIMKEGKHFITSVELKGKASEKLTQKFLSDFSCATYMDLGEDRLYARWDIV